MRGGAHRRAQQPAASISRHQHIFLSCAGRHLSALVPRPSSGVAGQVNGRCEIIPSISRVTTSSLLHEILAASSSLSASTHARAMAPAISAPATFSRLTVPLMVTHVRGDGAVGGRARMGRSSYSRLSNVIKPKLISHRKRNIASAIFKRHSRLTMASRSAIIGDLDGAVCFSAVLSAR